MISAILQAIVNNFGILWPLYWAQYGFSGAAPAIPFFFGPRYESQQSATNQIVLVLKDEPFVGAEIAQAQMPGRGAQGAGAPRQLSRFWLRIDCYLWGSPSTLPQWTADTDEDLLAPLAPTTANQNGSWFQCTTPGTTGSTEPIWPTVQGDTVTDGTVVWTCMGPVDQFRVYDTDVTDVMRTCMAGTMHYTLVGSYRPIRGTWYDKTDQLVMSGFTNRVSFEVLIPVPDVLTAMGQINSTNLDGVLNVLS